MTLIFGTQTNYGMEKIEKYLKLHILKKNWVIQGAWISKQGFQMMNQDSIALCKNIGINARKHIYKMPAKDLLPSI